MNTITKQLIWSTRKMFQCFLDHGANVSRFSNKMFLVQNIVTRSNLYTLVGRAAWAFMTCLILNCLITQGPCSLFKENGALRISKSQLKNTCSVEISARQKVSTLIMDVSAILWATHWPGKGGLVSDLLKTFRDNISTQLSGGNKHDVHVVFDRYYTDSIKGHTRTVRANGVTRRFHLQENTEIPPQKTLLSVTSNKMQLTNLIVKNLTEDPIVSKQKLVITGLEDVPLCIQDGLVTELTELKTTHKEADVIMI